MPLAPSRQRQADMQENAYYSYQGDVYAWLTAVWLPASILCHALDMQSLIQQG